MAWDDGWYEAQERRDDPSVLVGIVPSLSDWDIICREHWYRIPLATAPSRLGAEYLAFYHPKVFPELCWTISYYAPVVGYDIVKRRELLPQEGQHPHAEALYYKISLGPLRSLPRPIPSKKLRRVTFIPTTLPRLLSAREINDLWLPREPRQALWRDLQLSQPLAYYAV